MKLYRNSTNRTLFEVEIISKENWKVAVTQMGQALETETACQMIFGLLDFLSDKEEIEIPTAPTEEQVKAWDIFHYTGISGCQDFYLNGAVKTWYEQVGDMIVECRTSKKSTQILYSSMADKINCGLSVTQETVNPLRYIYNRYIVGYQEEKSWYDFTPMMFQGEWLEVKDAGIEDAIGCQHIKWAPDKSFFLWNYKGIIHRMPINAPFCLHNPAMKYIKDVSETAKEKFLEKGYTLAYTEGYGEGLNVPFEWVVILRTEDICDSEGEIRLMNDGTVYIDALEVSGSLCMYRKDKETVIRLQEKHGIAPAVEVDSSTTVPDKE